MAIRVAHSDIAFLLVAGIWLILPSIIQENARSAATATGVSTVSNFKKLREYYASNVVNKVLLDGNNALV